MPSLVLDPVPPLFGNVTENPYDDPSNPPGPYDASDGFCGMAWSNEIDPSTGLRMYTLANFTTEAEVEEAGFNVTHSGHCGACSSLQVKFAQLQKKKPTNFNYYRIWVFT